MPSIEEGVGALSARRRVLENIRMEVQNRINLADINPININESQISQPQTAADPDPELLPQ